MAREQIHTLTEAQAVARISETLKRAGDGVAPFALVLGAGFSQGLVPTSRELVVQSLPLWMKSLEDGEPFDTLQKRISPEELATVAREFWTRFIDRNTSYGLTLTVDATGMPDNTAAAYQAAFDPRYDGSVGSPSDARTFQRALMRLDQPRLNAAHFLLASILGVQPSALRRSDLFTKRAALTRLILTTNFDPFLQIALQSVNRLYFMSDTPDLGLGDEIFDNTTDAVHLVYVHGSIHRRSQKATDADIDEIKRRNARILAPVLKRHGVIVLGYSGWDDVIVDALVACESFDHLLYWCGRHPGPAVPGAFGERVAEVLAKQSALYVQIDSAGQFMARLSESLVRGLPRLLDNPIAQIRQMLEVIDLSELGEAQRAPSSDAAGKGLTGMVEARQSMPAVQGVTILRLRLAEAVFLGQAAPTAPGADATRPSSAQTEGADVAAPGAGGARAIDRLMSSIDVASALGNDAELLRLSDEALALPDLQVSEKSHLLQTRAVARFRRGDSAVALQDWGALASLPGVPVEELAAAHYNRGVASSHMGDLNSAIAEFTRAIDAPGAPVETVARALCNRGVVWGERKKPIKEIADYTRVIEALPGAPIEQMAIALNKRSVAWGRRGDTDKLIADCTRVIEGLPDAPVGQRAIALINRGLAWGRAGNLNREIADYTHVIEGLPGAPVDQVAIALNNRGLAWVRGQDPVREVADYTRVIEVLSGAPVAQVAIALNNRSTAWSRQGDLDKSIADSTRVIDVLPGAPVDLVAIALYNRGTALNGKDDPIKAIADYSRVISDLAGAPTEHVAKALNNRGAVWSRLGEHDKSIADTTRVIDDLPGAPLEQMAIALNTRALAWKRKRDAVREIEDYTRVIDALPDPPVEQVAIALNGRAEAWGRRRDGDHQLADLTRTIEGLPGAPVAQIARALNGRGMVFAARGEVDRAMADYTRVIEALPGAPTPQVAAAYTNRGWHFYEKGDLARFLADTQASVATGPGREVAAFNLGLALLANGRDREALDAYSQAAERYPSQIRRLALTDLARATDGWLSGERARPLVELLRARMPSS